MLAESRGTLEDKYNIFSLRTDMNDLPHHFARSAPCKYGCQEDMSNFHIFICQDPQEGAFEMLMNGNVQEKIEAKNRFQTKLTSMFMEGQE